MIDYALKFWNIFNVKTTVEGIHKGQQDCHPIRTVDDSHPVWLNKFGCMEITQCYRPTFFNTFLALSHTIKTFQIMTFGPFNASS